MAFADIKIGFDSDLMAGDFLFENNDLSNDKGLRTAALISLFTDRKAAADDTLPDPDLQDRRGWWGDLVSDVDGDRIGSRLWLLERSKATNDNMVRCRQYVKEALKWMLDDGVAVNMDVAAAIQGPVESRVLAFEVRILKRDGNTVSIRFEEQWEETFNGV